MKTRHGFVSNSSSSSFIIKLRDISQEQLDMIVDNPSHLDTMWWIDVYEHLGYVEGRTDMDNFDFRHYLTETVGVDPDVIKWDD